MPTRKSDPTESPVGVFGQATGRPTWDCLRGLGAPPAHSRRSAIDAVPGSLGGVQEKAPDCRFSFRIRNLAPLPRTDRSTSMPAYLKYFELERSPFEGRAQSKVVLGTRALRDAFKAIRVGLDEARVGPEVGVEVGVEVDVAIEDEAEIPEGEGTENAGALELVQAVSNGAVDAVGADAPMTSHSIDEPDPDGNPGPAWNGATQTRGKRSLRCPAG